MTPTGTGVSPAAEVYDAFFVPALFEQLTDSYSTPPTCGAGASRLDVGCGTGVLARAARSRVGEHGQHAGLDPNEGMLAVAVT